MKRWSLLIVLLAVFGVACQQMQKFQKDLQSGLDDMRAKMNATLGTGTWAPLADDAGAPAAVACTIPTHDDDYYGFSVGYPAGWHIDYSSGSILVFKDDKRTIGAMVYPARLRRGDVPAEKVATVFATGLARMITARGGTMTLSDQQSNGKVARATVHATVDGTELTGPLEVVVKPGFATLKLYWAPTASFATEQPTLAQVVGCFKRSTVITTKKPVAPAGGPVTRVGLPPKKDGSAAPVAALVPHHGPFYDAAMPAGWKIQDEGDHGIDLVAGDGLSSAGLGYSVHPGAGNPQATALQEIAQFWPGSHVLRTSPLKAGPQWNGVEIEFEGNGPDSAHGIARIAFGGGVEISTSMIAKASLWPKLHPTLSAIVDSFRIKPAATNGISAEWRSAMAAFHPPPPTSSSSSSSSSSDSSSDDTMSSWEADQAEKDRINRGFDDSIRGQDRCTSSDGDSYVCPWNKWSDSGPTGPGYYRQVPGGGVEQLQVVPSDSPEAD